jgi:hypothetical protein
MPLHDWRDDRGWNSLHIVWQNQLLDWIQPKLPDGYRAYLGSVPALTIDAPNGRPDLGVRRWEPEKSSSTNGTSTESFPEPDTETVAVFELDPQIALHIDFHGQLIAAIEIVSPRNKDRVDARERYLGRYVGYLRQGVHLMLIDLLPRPVGFSFADSIAGNLALEQPPCPVPFAMSYRVGESVPQGTLVGIWRRPMTIGEVLPTLPLALSISLPPISIDLEHTYMEAAKRVYLT